MSNRIEGFQTVEVYLGEHGDVCIKQEGYMGDDDHIVMLPPATIPRLIELLKAAAADAKRAPADSSEAASPPHLSVS